MFDAQILMSDSTGSTDVYSPWFARGGDNIRCTVEVLEVLDSFSQLTVSLYHKNQEDTGDGSALTGSQSRSSAGLIEREWTGLKELVRYKFSVESTDSPAGDAWVLFRALSALWFDTVDA